MYIYSTMKTKDTEVRS